MKKLFYLAIYIPVLALGQSTDQNYVKSTTYKQPTTTPLATPDVSAANVQVSYFDGLGRPVQQIAHKQSHSGKDIVTHMEYDAFGRQTKEFLPFANDAASLNYQDATATLMALNGFYSDYNGGTSNPYSEKQLENSPLSRVFKQAAPGNPWALGSGKEIKFDYQTNAQGEVRYFKVVASWNATKGLYLPSIVQTGHYEQNQLFKTITTDENGNKTEEFKDKEGRVILKRSFNLTPPSGAGGLYDTYYLYDQFGNLTYVIPPLAEGIASEQNLNGLGYQYRYDSRNRLVEKKLPGKQWEFIIYDKLDRPIATGPAFDPYGEGQIGWMVTEYDVFGRVTQTGWKKMEVSETQRKSNQASVMSGGNPFVLSQLEILTKIFYDTYHTATGAPTTSQTVEGQATVVHVKGMPTGSWVKVLDPTQPQAAETSYTLYDSKFRPVRTRTNNHLGGYTQVDTKLDWAGKTLYTLTKHKREQSSTELLVKDSFTYTAQDRLAVHKQQINQLPEQLLASNTYDELGQLISKNVGGTDVTGTQGLQKVDYTYNIRGWLKGINDTNDIQSENDVFAFKINYNDPEHAAEALHNGNISETHWKTASDNILRLYHYQYDDLNRMISGNYIREGGNYHNSFLETLEYDKNGNITNLYRNGDNDAVDYVYPIDELKYDYHPQKPNQLMKVTDESNSPQGFKDGTNTGDDYAYDANGNMISDQNKNIENIGYNHLNLPTKIIFGDGNQIMYLYNATGQKLSKVVQAAEEIRTDYLTGFQYHKRDLNFFPHAEGYVSVVEGRFKYVFNYTDHLGNIRLSYSDANGDNNIQQEEILEESNYYPFGLKHTAYNTNQKKYIKDEVLNELILSFFPRFAGDGRYNYKLKGKEWQDELGLNEYAFGFRDYDPAIGRWNVIDPLAEKYITTSPYAFVQNNPLINREIDGRYFDKKNDKQAKKIEKAAEKQANKLEKQANKLIKDGKSAGDLMDRVAELRNSVDDIKEMRKNEKTEFKYSKVGSKEFKKENLTGPSTRQTGTNAKGDNVVTMFVEGNMGNQIHETRHGGDFARGNLSFNNTGGYGVSHEISAYKAQYSYDGTIKFIDPNKNPTQTDIKNSMQTGTSPWQNTINGINQINASFVNSLVDPGFIPIYPPSSIPSNIWNSN